MWPILLKNYHNVLIAIYWCDNPSSGDLIISAAALCMSITDTVIRQFKCLPLFVTGDPEKQQVSPLPLSSGWPYRSKLFPPPLPAVQDPFPVTSSSFL